MIKLPTNWNEVTYKQFIELQFIDSTENIFLQYINILSILTNTDPTSEIWEDMDIEDLKVLINQIDWIKSSPKPKLLENFDDFILKSNENLTLGEYIDLDYYSSHNFLENLPKVATIYYRHYKNDEFGNVILEPYDIIDLNKRSEEFADRPILEILPLVKYFQEYKMKIYNNSTTLFIPVINENDEDLDEEDLDDPEVVEEIAKEKLQEEWNWVLVLHNLSKGDITKNDAILNMSFISILNQLTFKKLFNLD
jgi:hypothetical protein